MIIRPVAAELLHADMSDFNENSVFSTDFRKIIVSNFMKIRPVAAELLHADTSDFNENSVFSTDFRK